MKKKLTIALLIFAGICVGSASPSQTGSTSKLVNDSPTNVVWAGLDYSLARLIGDDKFEYGFSAPNLIFPGMLEMWNQLYIDERLGNISDDLGKSVLVDVAGITDRNRTAAAGQIISDPGPQDVIGKTHISPEMIAAEVQSYKMANTNGMGLVFIIDRLVYGVQTTSSARSGKASFRAAAGAVYVVFFDIATRQVISTNRKVNSTSSGSSFRNFWFGPIKDADSGLKLPK